MPGAGELIEVELVQVPLAVHARASQHLDDLRRELTLIRERTGHDGSVPARVFELARRLDGQFGGLGADENAAMRAAAARGDESVDLTYVVPPVWAEACTEILVQFEAVDDLCRRGELLTLAATAETRRYLYWVFGEFIRQARGEAPRSGVEHLAAVLGGREGDRAAARTDPPVASRSVRGGSR